ncbi:MAG: septum formation initiator family protein [Rikenellaceae bacterium]
MKWSEILRKDWGWVLATVVIGGAIVINIGRSTLRSIEIQREINALTREANGYLKRIKADSILIESLKHDDLLEKYARERHNMQHPSEDVYIIEE